MSPAPPVCFKRFPNSLRDTVSDQIRLAKTNFALRRVYVTIHRLRIHFQEQKGDRKLTLHQRGVITLPQSVLNRDVFHGSTIHKKDLLRFRGPAYSDFADETGNSDPASGLRFDFQQLFEQFRTPQVSDAV